MTSYSSDSELYKLVNSEEYKDRIKAAKQGYGLDILVYDENYEVRAAVDKYLAEHGLTIYADELEN